MRQYRAFTGESQKRVLPLYHSDDHGVRRDSVSILDLTLLVTLDSQREMKVTAGLIFPLFSLTLR